MDYVPVSKSGRLWDGKMDIFKAFRKASAAGAGESITALYDPTLHRDIPGEPDLRDLNVALAILVDIFPDAEPEALRAMLSSVSKSSRVEIVTEQMLKNDAKKMRGSKVLQKLRPAEKSVKRSKIALATEETFRSDVYKKAVKQVLYQEFRSLSHSSIKAVLAEQNYSYRGSRPVLQQLVAKTWRFSLSNIWSRQSPSNIEQDHPSITRLSNTIGVKRTGSSELDQELHELLVVPILQQRRHDQLTADHQLASQLNEADPSSDWQYAMMAATHCALTVYDARRMKHSTVKDGLKQSICRSLHYVASLQHPSFATVHSLTPRFVVLCPNPVAKKTCGTNCKRG
ncbi:hypothetical protein LTR97_005615 [Elasticomyces elasticus]|uniref:E3 ubiquitin-protein ligase RNF216 UBA domain-containing protein n=1 Tax=Elasticomyces elasticus TaxID=574655 RepID=A0AAN7ZTW1_9PEZI|nr:hypothetical protein LTR97_005615 [Elasticomyces elasticus]